MKIFDRGLLRKRQESIRETVRESSPVLVWPGTPGILVVAAVKSAHQERIYPVHDRMALVFRGEFASAYGLAGKAISAAYELMGHYGPDEVDPAVILGILGQRIGESYESPFGTRVSAEAVLVRLEQDPAADFIGVADCDGETERIEGPIWRGPLAAENDDRQRTVEERLKERYDPALTPPQVAALLAEDPVLGPAMQPHVRLETVFLDRAAAIAETYGQVIRRLP